MSKRIKYPVRACELIGKNVHPARNGRVYDANNAVVHQDITYEEAEDLAIVMNHVEGVWRPRFDALKRRVAKLERRGATEQ